MTEAFNEIGKIAEDLVNIEVNTILKSDINALKMPKPRHAFFDIGKEYFSMLEGFGCLSEDLYEDDEDAEELLNGLAELMSFEDRLGSCDAFSYMRQVANYKIKKNKVRIEEMDATDSDRETLNSEVSMLYRIKDNSDQIKGIFNTQCQEYLIKEGKLNEESADKLTSTAMCNEIDDSVDEKKFLTNLLTRAEIEFYQKRPLILNADQLALLRKIWEVGTTEIAMQTVVQLDGDVVTRILNKYTTEDFAILHQLHNEGVTTAIDFWKDLVGLVKDFVENIVQMAVQPRT